jgi:hypothetical protein
MIAIPTDNRNLLSTGSIRFAVTRQAEKRLAILYAQVPQLLDDARQGCNDRFHILLRILFP